MTKKRINISLSPEALARLDEFARQEETTRSAAVAMLPGRLEKEIAHRHDMMRIWTSQPRSLQEAFLRLLGEVDPETVVYRTVSNDVFTAQRLIDGLKDNDEVSRMWASDVLRVSRDLLIRRAKSAAGKPK